MESAPVETRPAEPTPKRRGGKRTARACDECHCTYNLSASRSTGSGTRIRILEDRLRRARAYLNEAQRRTPSLAGVNFDALLGPTDEYSKSNNKTDAKAPEQSDDEEHDDDADDQDEKLESMMDAYGQMTMNSHDNMARDFYGAASGLAFIKRTKDILEMPNGKSPSSDDSLNDMSNSATVQLFDAPLPPKQAFRQDVPVSHLLPLRPVADRLVRVVFTEVYPMFHFLCAEDFDTSTDRIYDKDSDEYDDTDYSFLPLFYVVVGLGYLFSREEHDKHGCRNAIAQGMRHFIAGRKMMDIAHLRTIVSLQAVTAIILFLISTARIASAHAFVGVACAAAMRQGLHHRSTHEVQLPQTERKVRRRVFWAVMNLDMYVSSILGLPPFMDLTAVDPAIDATIELALGDFHNSAEKAADLLALAASAKHIELLRIIFKAQRTLFPKPPDPPDSAQQVGSIKVNVRDLRKVESQFQEWAKSLAEILSYPGTSEEILSLKYEIQVCYCFGHIVLYRAFLHYIAKDKDDVAIRQREYAEICIRMASRVVNISINRQREGLLCPASWPSLYTVFMSTICLLLAYVVRNGEPDASALREDIQNGIKLLACTACTTDTGSVRCLEILRRLISRVSDSVNIDVDEICNNTKPCCTTNFNPAVDTGSNERDKPINLAAKNIRSSSMSQSSTPSWFHSIRPDPVFSPDPTMTQPSLSSIDYVSPPTAAQSATQYTAGDETMEIDPYIEQFAWPSSGAYARRETGGGSAPEATQSGQHQQHQEQQHQQQGRQSSASRLTPRDIATFMRMNADDDFDARG